MALEAKRTLVKSAPELWAEVSDVAALARHLGELGEIRITRAQPEELVEWEGDRATGTVRLEPSGWGTRVTLTAEPTPPPEEPAAPEAEPVAITPEPAGRPSPPRPLRSRPNPPRPSRPSRRQRRPPRLLRAPVPALPPAGAARRRRARRIRHGRAGRAGRGHGEADVRPAVAAPDVPPTVTAEPVEPPVATAEPDVPPAVAAEPDEPATDAPTPDDDAVLAILTGTLDRLGSAHHRPFSRG